MYSKFIRSNIRFGEISVNIGNIDAIIRSSFLNHILYDLLSLRQIAGTPNLRKYEYSM